ncbi:MAG: tetratricopeptide repeat protein [Deltaproteobacteria bacterium]|nr:tetratricopeptide repeat protein [Deltaproteobacteria bacterium]
MDIKNNKIKAQFNFRGELLIYIFIAITIFAAYWHLPKNDFISFDDNLYVTENLHVQEELTAKKLIWTFTTFHAFNWHPLTWLSHMLDFQLFGLNPSMHHFMNLLFHILNSILLFVVLNEMTKNKWPCAFVSILFALHPLHVESVAWVSERKDLLSTFFWILTMWSYFRYTKKPSIKKYIPVFLLFMLGLMAKPMIVTLPFVLLLLDIWPIRRMAIGKIYENNSKNIKRITLSCLVLEKVPLFMLSVISSVITIIAQKEGGIVRTLQELPISIRLANAFVSYIRYIWKMVFPLDLSFYYPYPNVFPSWQIFGSLLLIICITLVAIKKARDMPFLLVGWLWYLGTLVPVIGLVQIATQSIADRYTYIPSIGLFIIIAWGGSTFVNRYRKLLTPSLAISFFILILLTIMTWKQVRYWQNDIQLFSHAIEVTVDNPRSHYHLGLALEKENKNEKAINHYKEAVRIRPDFLRARNSLGKLLAKAGRYESAVEHYTYALRLNQKTSEGHFNLGFALMKTGNLDEAVKHYTKAIEIDKEHADAHYNLGVILSRQKRHETAAKQFIEVIRINPKDAEAYNNLGNSFLRLGKIKEAVKYYKKAVKVNPNYPTAQKNLNIVLKHMEKNKIRY